MALWRVQNHNHNQNQQLICEKSHLGDPETNEHRRSRTHWDGGWPVPLVQVGPGRTQIQERSTGTGSFLEPGEIPPSSCSSLTHFLAHPRTGFWFSRDQKPSPVERGG